MRQTRFYSYLLVAIQFLCLIALALTGPLIARTPLLLLVELAGIALGVWAIATMRIFNFNITPEVKADGVMVDKGPYRWIRHPMYTALIVVGLALLLESFSWIRLAIWLILVADLAIKLHYEEALLQSHYPAYAAYMARTKRLIPGVY